MSIEKIKRKKGRAYRARFKIKYNRFQSPWFQSEAQAEEWEARKRIELADGQSGTSSEMTLHEFSRLWLEKHSFVNKVYSSALRDEQLLRIHVLPILGHNKLRNLKTRDFAFLFADLRANSCLKPKTINNCLGVVKKMLNDAVSWGMLSHSPAAPVRRLKLHYDHVTVFSYSEAVVLLRFTKQHYPEEHAMIRFALNTGSRLGECLGLQWSKLDLHQKTAVVDTIFDKTTNSYVNRTKGKKSRKIPLNSDSVRLLRELALSSSRECSEYVFGDTFKDSHSHQRFRRILKEADLKAAIERRATFHTTRHTFASEFMRQRGDLYQLQKILGHSTITQTEKYAHFSPDFLTGQTEAISFFNESENVISMRKDV